VGGGLDRVLVSLLADAWGWSSFFRTVVAALPALPRCSAPLWVRESGERLCALRRAAWAAWLRGRACAVQVEVVAAPLAAPASRRPCWAVDEGLRLLPSVSPVGWQGFWSQGFARGRLFFQGCARWLSAVAWRFFWPLGALSGSRPPD